MVLMHTHKTCHTFYGQHWALNHSKEPSIDIDKHKRFWRILEWIGVFGIHIIFIWTRQRWISIVPRPSLGCQDWLGDSTGILVRVTSYQTVSRQYSSLHHRRIVFHLYCRFFGLCNERDRLLNRAQSDRQTTRNALVASLQVTVVSRFACWPFQTDSIFVSSLDLV